MAPGKKRHTKTSIRILQVIILAAWILLFGRLFQLQILDYETYNPISRENHLRQEIVNPARGLLLDRNGVILVENEPIYSITIIPASFDNSSIPLLAELLETTEPELLSRIEAARDYSTHRTSRLYSEVSFDVFSNIQENIWQLPGIGHKIESKRHYPAGIKAAHTLGYLREADDTDHSANTLLRLGDKVGKSGLEMSYEDQLRGDIGAEYIRVNAFGQALGTYNNGELNKAPVKGNDIYTTLDSDLQRLAEQSMEGKRGGLVAMDPQTGEILAIVSSPQYDIQRLAGRIDSDYWQAVNADTTNPLFNRAIATEQPPGSTFKPFMGLVGLHLGLITPQTVVYDPGYYTRGRRYASLADPGNYDLVKAIRHSSNTYFFALMDQIATNRQRYLDTWSSLIMDFGIGDLNAIDIPFERARMVPNTAVMNELYGEGNWGVGDLLSLGIGQGMVSASPLQMAVAVSALANGGYRMQPHLVRATRNSDGSISYAQSERTKIEWVRDEYLDVVQSGMEEAIVEGGTNFYFTELLDDFRVAGKTGTAQNPNGNDHGWFIGFAPADNPRIAIAVLVENGGFGSQSAAPVASLLMEQYILGELSRPHIIDRVNNFVPMFSTNNNDPE